MMRFVFTSLTPIKKEHNASTSIISIVMDTNRVSKELREIASDGASGVSVELVGDSLAHMRGTITGASHNRDVDVFFSVFFRVWCNEIQNIIIIVVVACRLDRNTNSRQNAVVLSLLLLLRDRSV